MKALDSKEFFSIKDKSGFDKKMIRFVIYNKDFLIPDLYSSFKGKEFFVRSSKNELKKFSEVFNKEYKKSFNKNNIVEIIENILIKHIVGVISLARKAKKVIIGIDEIKFHLKKNKICFLLQANNLSFKRKENLSLPIHQKIKINCFTKEELGIAFGKKNIANIGFLKSSFINSIISDSYRLQSFRN